MRLITVSGLPIQAAVLVLAFAIPAAAQAPASGGQQERYKNLKVLPPDTTKEQLTVIMHGFSDGLGVGCDFCHTGTWPKMDWASDEKDEKRSARVMLKMTQAINKDTLPALEGMSDDAEVTCYTCHRGAKHPTRRLADILADTTSTKGAAAAVDQYKQLHDKSADAGLYDFRPQQLAAAADKLRDEKQNDQAVALGKAAAALFPQSSPVAVSLGMALAQAGDTPGAEKELQRALTLDPNNFMAKGALERLRNPQGRPQ